MNQLNAMKVFRRVVDLNGFSTAARDLGMSNAAISKNVSDLEAHLGAQLLVRTTRRISVTEIGQAYYRRCVSILKDLEEADLTAGSSAAEPRGRLRVNAPMSFGLLHVVPLISNFLSQYEEIGVDTDEAAGLTYQQVEALVPRGGGGGGPWFQRSDR